MSENEFSFRGFDTPKQNWFRLPNEWVDICAEIGSLAEIKVVQYVMRHTLSSKAYGIRRCISIDEFMNGRWSRDGERIDKGTGLSKPSVIAGLRSALERGLLNEEIDSADSARGKKFYPLRMNPANLSEIAETESESLHSAKEEAVHAR